MNERNHLRETCEVTSIVHRFDRLMKNKRGHIQFLSFRIAFAIPGEQAGHLDRQSLVVQSVGVLIGIPLFIAGNTFGGFLARMLSSSVLSWHDGEW